MATPHAPIIAVLTFEENRDEDDSRPALKLRAEGAAADLARVAWLLGLSHGTVRVPGSLPVAISLPNGLAGVIGNAQWKRSEPIQAAWAPPNKPTREDVLFHLDRMIHQWDDDPDQVGYHPDALWLEEVRALLRPSVVERRSI